MCKKLFDSLICNITFFLIAYAGLASTSGIALRLGGMLMSQQEPENREYSFYATESGFFIGVKSGAFFQWMTAGFIALFAKLNASYLNKQLCDRLTAIYLQNFLLLALFAGLHSFSLPVSVLDEAKCTDLQEQIMSSKESRPENPLCKESHTWDNLLKAFSVGVSIFFIGCLVLQTMYIFLSAACEIETAPNVEPAAEPPREIIIEPAPVVTLVEMMSMPTDDVNFQSHAPYA